MTLSDLHLRAPYLNAPGTLGFSPNPRGPLDLARLGAFVTNPVSLAPRTPAEARVLVPYPGGFLLHTGHPNPGLRVVLRQHARRWAGSSLPVIVHILPGTPEEAASLVRRLEGLEGVMGIEAGLPPHISPEEAGQIAQAAQGELPLLVCIPVERVDELVPALHQAGIKTVSLQAPRGTLPGPGGKLVSGRLYGPAVLPLALAGVQSARRAGLEVVGGGGVYRDADAQALLSAGAAAVVWDAVLWQSWEGERGEKR